MKKECALIRGIVEVRPSYREDGSLSSWGTFEYLRAKTRRLKTLFHKADLGIRFDIVGEDADRPPQVYVTIWDSPQFSIKGRTFRNDRVIKVLIDECILMKKRAESAIARLNKLKKEMYGPENESDSQNRAVS